MLEARDTQVDEMTEYAAAYDKLRNILDFLNVKRRSKATRFVRTTEISFASSAVPFRLS